MRNGDPFVYNVVDVSRPTYKTGKERRTTAQKKKRNKQTLWGLTTVVGTAGGARTRRPLIWLSTLNIDPRPSCGAGAAISSAAQFKGAVWGCGSELRSHGPPVPW